MRPRLIAAAILLGALTAHGDIQPLTQPMIDALTPIDALPSVTALDGAFGAPALGALLALAQDPTADLGLSLRAIGALPGYCPAAQICGPGTTVHDALIGLIDGFQPAQHTPQDLLRLRAAVAALGATGAGLQGDIDKLLALLPQLLGSGSRDARAAVARTIGKSCNAAAIVPLSSYLHDELVPQVQLAIQAALQDLEQCGN